MLTIEQRVFVWKTWWENYHYYSRIWDLFVEHFPNIEASPWQSIHKLNLWFEGMGSVTEPPRSSTPNSVTIEKNVNVVAQCFVQASTTSQRKGIWNSNNKTTKDSEKAVIETIQTYFISKWRWFGQARREEIDFEFYKRNLWSNEATFKMIGRVNTQLCLLESKESPSDDAGRIKLSWHKCMGRDFQRLVNRTLFV